jgi:hypothetical protein
MTDNFLEIFRQMAFISSIIAGFGIAVAIELIALKRKGPLISSAIGLFLVSSIEALAATFIFVIVMSSTLSPAGSSKPSEAWIIHFLGGIGMLPFSSYILFLGGIGVVGWLHSKVIGIVTSVAAAAAVVFVILLMRSSIVS